MSVICKKGVLTPTELDVLKLIGKGLTHKQIARSDECTSGSDRTVEEHVGHIRDKLGSVNAASMIMDAFEQGIFKLLPCFLMLFISLGCVLSGWADDDALRRAPRSVRSGRTFSRPQLERLGGLAA